MYALVWASFFQIFLVILLLSIPITGFSYNDIVAVHAVIGIVVISLAFTSFRLVRKTNCPKRIKRITTATAVLGAVQGILGIVLYLLIRFNASVTVQNLILLFHVVTALAIIAQASSAATAFDMWEEKEFETPPAIAAPR